MAKQKIVKCPRCEKRCVGEATQRPESRPFQKSLKGMCLECTVSAFFQDENQDVGIGFALPKDFPPDGLRLPHIQDQIRRVLAAGMCEASFDEIDWDEIIANWHLPFGTKHQSYRERKSWPPAS